MLDTATKIISLLERLSVVAPERCNFRYGCFSVRLDVYGDVLVTNTYGVNNYTMPQILMAVLEEAHAQGWEWEKGSSAWELGKGLKVFAMVRGDKGGILEREVLPRLECLVMALESQP